MKKSYLHCFLRFQADQKAKIKVFRLKRQSAFEWATRLDRLAFTLIELLLIIAIIAILLAILTPTLFQVRLLAKRTACLANLGVVGKAALIYQTVYNGYVPICWGNLNDSNYPFRSWRTNLLTYTSGYTVFNCPATSDNDQNGAIFHSDEEITGDKWHHTINAGSYGVIYQYSLPSYETLSCDGNIQYGHPMWSCAFPTKPGVAWRDPPNSVYVADSCVTEGPVTYPTQIFNGYGISVINPPSASDYFNINRTFRFADRHLGTNCLFLDGKVLSYETKDLDSMTAGKENCVWDTE